MHTMEVPIHTFKRIYTSNMNLCMHAIQKYVSTQLKGYVCLRGCIFHERGCHACKYAALYVHKRERERESVCVCVEGGQERSARARACSIGGCAPKHMRVRVYALMQAGNPVRFFAHLENGCKWANSSGH
jgi:hypothetical protein